MRSEYPSLLRSCVAFAGSICLGVTCASAQAPPSASPSAVQPPAPRPAQEGKVARRPAPGPAKAAAPDASKRGSRLDVRRPPGVRMPRPGAGTGAINSRPTSIQGSAWHSDNAPVSKALLRLRNVVTGQIEATTVASEAGNFAFNGIPDGMYLIELVTDEGKVIMVGHTFTVAPGETVATFIRLGPKVPWFNGFFGNAAQAVSATAASTGITAIAPEVIPPVSPGG